MSYPTTTFISSPTFHTFPEENLPRYRCCCNSNSIEKGAIIVGIIQIVFNILAFISAFIDYYNGSLMRITYPYFVAILVFTVLQFVVATIMIYGISKENQWLTLPALIFDGIGCISLIISTVGRTVICFGAGLIGFALFFLIFFGLFSALYIWFFVVILRCFQYISAKKEWYKNHHQSVNAAIPVYSVQFGQNAGYPQPPNAGYPMAQFQPGNEYKQ